MHDIAAHGIAVPALATFAALACLLLCGGIMHSDITQRRIPNAYCAAIALMAIAWWIGGQGWPGLLGFGRHLYLPLVAAVPLLVLFGLRVLAGGDVKLMLALLLWVPQSGVAAMVIVTIIGGGVLALMLCGLKRLFCAVNASTVPYGVPIVAGALLILIPQFRLVL